MRLAPLRLKKNEDRRLRAGHLWIFSNEVDVVTTPLGGFEAGQAVDIYDSRGKPLGSAYVNPQSLICARMISRLPGAVLDQALLVNRLKAALALRDTLFDKPFYRLVFGEGDRLPGLVIDRHGDTAVIQITTAGMERCKDAIIAALHEVVRPSHIVLRNDAPLRKLEGLELYVTAAAGTAPEQTVIEENGARFAISPMSGQKTGWFYDHRLNRARMQQYVHGRRVLDVFSYSGAWGIQAAVAGAAAVTCIDSSARAVDELRENADLNAIHQPVVALVGDAFDALKTLRTESERYDVVIVDPPAFIKRKKDLKEGLQAYHRINEHALQLVEPGGILISASCSFHLERTTLREVLLKAAQRADVRLQILEQGHQAPDHPVHPAIPETDYLKSYICRVLPAEQRGHMPAGDSG
ncbi:MAG: 23S rRNA (cytosine1962-C5)-methyltransferase [Gammaproteobacteria bacterium]|nr:MAG: 23S rRNA (cytosine1962-C5)-methyltransferase [Gammaproteobacteria bacterium]TND03949.1 MAG: 23S rRNA (cytosine1962-C5)-methyltransferase [Gammaproteobacteria bacterium]